VSVVALELTVNSTAVWSDVALAEGEEERRRGENAANTQQHVHTLTGVECVCRSDLKHRESQRQEE
jgi:hypothetical protein